MSSTSLPASSNGSPKDHFPRRMSGLSLKYRDGFGMMDFLDFSRVPSQKSVDSSSWGLRFFSEAAQHTPEGLPALYHLPARPQRFQQSVMDILMIPLRMRSLVPHDFDDVLAVFQVHPGPSEKLTELRRPGATTRGGDIVLVRGDVMILTTPFPARHGHGVRSERDGEPLRRQGD